MGTWNLITDFEHQVHSFSISATTNYNELRQTIFNHYKISMDNYLLEIHDSYFKHYIVLNEEYFISLKDRLSRVSQSTLHGRITRRPLPSKKPADDIITTHHKRIRSLSSSLNYDYLIIWLDSSIEKPAKGHYLLHKFIITTMLNVARPMLDYEDCIDHLIQINSKLINGKSPLNIFNNKKKCLDFFKQIESKMKIIFIISSSFSEEVVPLIFQRVHFIYILINNDLFSYEWALPYKANLLIFENELVLLIRLIRDLAKGFVEKAEMTSNSSMRSAIKFLKWAREFYKRANHIEDPCNGNVRRFIDHRLETLEMNWLLKASEEFTNNKSDDKFALECDDV